jgi:eukaryotic-like serine/threonine-protein kinase
MLRPPMLQIGDQFDHFQILGHMAQGGMSDVYRAFDLLTSKEVVLKIPDKMSIGDPAQYERFQRELEVMETLRHPAIQNGLGSGRYNSTPYLITELVVGKSMRELTQESVPLPAHDAVQLIRKIADGIAYCHDHGIIHRDLKPENILITNNGQPIILDFGLALTKKSYRVTYANLSSTAGTPDYMAPEQIEGQRGDQRTDLYAVGIMLFELLTGRVPFSGDNNLAVMSQHLRGAIPRLDIELPGVSPQLAAVVMRCLQREPNDRYSDLHAFVYDLDHLDEVDISILDASSNAKGPSLLDRMPFFKPIASALIILMAIIIVALLLQSVRR